MISARNVSKWFGPVRAVQGVSFEIPAGQIVGLLGPNGAGKTTTIRMITGYTPPSAGSVAVCGHDTISDSLAARRSLGYLPESAPLYPEMRVRDYLGFRGKLFGLRGGALHKAVESAAERCWLTDVRHRRIGHLSKGYRQRVGLASALLHDPAVLVLDEPTSGLDPTQIRETRGLIRSLSANRTVLVSSHILPEVEKTCDRVIIIAAGRLRADGSPAQLLADHRGQTTYAVEVDAPGDRRSKAGEVLGAVPGVASLREDASVAGGWARFVVSPKRGDQDLGAAIGAACRAAGLAIRELHRQSPTLEQVFVSLIEQEQAIPTEREPARRRAAAANA